MAKQRKAGGKKRGARPDPKATKERNKAIARTKRFQEKMQEPVPITIVPPPTTTEQSNWPVPVPVGKVSVTEDVKLNLNMTSPTTGVRIDLDQVGLGHDADSVVESSGNLRYLDAARPPVIEDGDLLVFFDPEMVPGLYGFQFTFTWDKDMETVMPKPLVDGKYAGIEEAKARRKAKGK